MALGPGKYDDVCSMVRKQVGMTDDSPGGVLVIVMGGNKGSGFACQSDFPTMVLLPDMLEEVARQIRESGGVA
jgi:hypothetical protein